MIIDGKKIAAEVIGQLKTRPKPDKFFGAVLVGEDPASVNFLKQKEKVAKELGIEFRLYQLSTGLATDDLRAEIGRLSRPKNCGGFIVQLPLPEKINRHYVLNAIPREKDPDCLSEAALGAFYTERGAVVPPSVATVQEILQRLRAESPSDVVETASEAGFAGNRLRELKAVMIGAGFLIGKPVGFWLQNKVAELVVLDAGVKDIHSKLADADIVISGAGHAHLFGPEDLKPGAVVIDFGFNRNANGKIVGDFNNDMGHGTWDMDIDYTPTPGGTGPILVAKLFENFYELNRAD
ncbi:MAG: bifunctional 5,10-methylenetetrahydrofolate dehydrogenase/5,10-methenyltetrahydrofolate cyclohydrolase [Patescibacteria group bacterium]|nr:bifunctional 5,10-methylenetetrahydrofolate dehydrogenase/5,10-methenyltetrahydrofolate cyclohydrolase [Patescibacteria group bacterium]